MIGQPVTAAWGGNKGNIILLGDSAGKVCHCRERTAVNQGDPWTQPTGPSTTSGRTHLEARHVCGEIKAVNLLVGDQGRDTASRGGGKGDESTKLGRREAREAKLETFQRESAHWRRGRRRLHLADWRRNWCHCLSLDACRERFNCSETWQRVQLGQGVMMRKQRDGRYLCIVLEQSWWVWAWKSVAPSRKTQNKAYIEALLSWCMNSIGMK